MKRPASDDTEVGMMIEEEYEQGTNWTETMRHHGQQAAVVVGRVTQHESPVGSQG